MPDYSNFPPESTDNTPLVYYFPSYYSLQETVTSAKLNSLIRCYNILVEKFMQHNHTGGVNANNENTRAVKLAACACLVDESIFTQCLAHECVTNDKIYDLSYRKIFLSNEPGNEYTLPQKINDMDTDIANRVHLSIDNDIYANNTFYVDTNSTSYAYKWLNEEFYDTLYHASDFIDTTKEWDVTETAAINTNPKSIYNKNTTKVEKVLIDEAESIIDYALRDVLQAEVVGASFSIPMLELPTSKAETKEEKNNAVN